MTNSVDLISNKPKFIVDHNVGKLARWLRLMGYDARFFDGDNDSDMITIALAEDRVVLTRDTEIIKRRVITSGRLKAILIDSDNPEQQICQVIKSLNLDRKYHPFTRCLECTQLLDKRSKLEIENRVPPYVYKTQNQYMECPNCHRIYWRGTHWQAMIAKLDKLSECFTE